MENKDIEPISEFFPKERKTAVAQPERKWEEIFASWIDKIDQEKMMLNLFELKLWFEALDEFNTSPEIEELVFRGQPSGQKNYEFYLTTFQQVALRLTQLLKELDFKKDKYLLNFEEFIVEKLLEDHMEKSLSYLKTLYSPESWFYSFRLFLQNFRLLIAEILAKEFVSPKTYSSVKKLFHRELINNPILISLLKKQFIPKMDRIYQPDITKIISGSRDRQLKKALGIFFILAFRILKITNFIEMHLSRSKNLDLTVPLILILKKSLGRLIAFIDTNLIPGLTEAGLEKKQVEVVGEMSKNLKLEFKKIGTGELPFFFEDEGTKVKRRKVVKNILIIAEIAMQELIETVARLFRPEISGSSIFENYISRKQKSIEVKKKLIKLHTMINDYFVHSGAITPAEIFFEVNLFMESDLNYLLYKDWNEFLSYYNNLSRSNFSAEFEPMLRAFHSFLTRILKEIISEKRVVLKSE